MNNQRTVYFAGSIRGGREDQDKYARIINELKKYATVLTEHVGNNEMLKQEKNLSDVEIHHRDMEWLRASDVVVAEVTQPSLGVGYELAMALHLKKTVHCLFNAGTGKRLSAMINGQKEFNVINYETTEELPHIIGSFFTE